MHELLKVVRVVKLESGLLEIKGTTNHPELKDVTTKLKELGVEGIQVSHILFSAP